MGLGEERGQIEGVADAIHPETLEEGLAAGRNNVDKGCGEKGGKIMFKKLWAKIKGFFVSVGAAVWEFIADAIPPAKEIIIDALKGTAVEIVATLNMEDLLNEEKRKIAFDKIKEVAEEKGIEVRDSVINLLIELAVSWLKEQKV